jgi:hypothetical protein
LELGREPPNITTPEDQQNLITDIVRVEAYRIPPASNITHKAKLFGNKYQDGYNLQKKLIGRPQISYLEIERSSKKVTKTTEI